MLEHALSVIPNLDKCLYEGATLITRIDINSPIYNNKITDDFRIRAHARTLAELSKAGSKVVVLAHQGRPGQDDFTSLALHRELLAKYLGRPIEFVEDIIGPYALKRIKKLDDGEVLLLENVRMLSEELVEAPPERHAHSWLVEKLAPLARYYVFDGFAVAHRSQPSVVGFPMRLPSCLGRVMEGELRALSEVWRNRDRAVLVVGGAKVPESLRAIAEVLERGLTNKVLVGGLVAAVFASARYGAKRLMRSFLEEKGLVSEVEKARRLLDEYKDNIILPIDFKFEGAGEARANDLAEVPADIGDETILLYKDIIKNYDIIVITGPLGKIENEKFIKGTYEILKEASAKRAVIGGGHTILATERAGLLEKMYHISTGGRAFLMALSEGLPAVRALIKSAEMYWRA
ncbi:MAG: phosphoglycerate kinase [Thermoproteus sp.]|nr:phosphoglycerate kinase [Thermoproteus sp.]